ncbi:unnamed protein product, partial [Closterium sp. NIES-53]
TVIPANLPHTTSWENPTSHPLDVISDLPHLALPLAHSPLPLHLCLPHALLQILLRAAELIRSALAALLRLTHQPLRPLVNPALRITHSPLHALHCTRHLLPSSVLRFSHVISDFLAHVPDALEALVQALLHGLDGAHDALLDATHQPLRLLLRFLPRLLPPARSITRLFSHIEHQCHSSMHIVMGFSPVQAPPSLPDFNQGMWIFRVKRPPGSPPVFKARYVARGFSQRQGVD